MSDNSTASVFQKANTASKARNIFMNNLSKSRDKAKAMFIPSDSGQGKPSGKRASFIFIPTADLAPKDAKMKVGYVHALGMILCLFVFLASIYTSQEPFRYMSSNLALQKALHLSELKEKALNRKEIWHWLSTIISEIGGHTVDKIEANCAYSKFKSQKVTIDGHDYDLLDPSQKISSCPEENMKHIDGAEEVTYMAGSHQLLSFGVFTKRSVPHEPIKGSVKVDSHLHEIPSDDVRGIDPAHDHKVADVCHVGVRSPTGGFNDTLCVLIDGFKDKIGTSVNWSGELYDVLLTCWHLLCIR